jgi:hypothetical protein
MLIKLEFFDKFSKNVYILNLIKIRPVGAELFHAEGQTDKTKLIVAFSNFANAPNEMGERDSKSFTGANKDVKIRLKSVATNTPALFCHYYQNIRVG